VADTFQSVTRVISTTPQNFFDVLADAPKKDTSFEVQKRDNYFRLWEAEEHRTERSMRSFRVSRKYELPFLAASNRRNCIANGHYLFADEDYIVRAVISRSR